MKITDMQLFHIKPRWMFLKISTDAGISGWGEPILEGRAKTVETAVNEYRKMLIGEDPLRIEHLVQLMYRGTFYRGGPILMSALSGIEMALWDIKGKFYNAPIYDMLGGYCRTQIRMYGHLKPTGLAGDFPLADMLDITKKRLEQGFTAMKYSVIPPIKAIDTLQTVHKIVERFAAVRSLVGDGVDVAVDFHGRVNPAMSARLLKELEPYYPMFVEEPVLPENVDVMVNISRATTIPIAAGERLMGKWGYRELIEKQAVRIIQPDLCHCGGILEAKKIASMAELYYMQVAPHNPLGPIALAACIQLDACIPNFLAQEHPAMPDGRDLGVGLLENPFEIERNGCITIPKGPGLGIEVNEEAVLSQQCQGDWDTPHLFFEDGSLADW